MTCECPECPNEAVYRIEMKCGPWTFAHSEVCEDHIKYVSVKSQGIKEPAKA